MQTPSKRVKYLTKSNYLIGLSCAKAIWLKFNKPEALPEVDEQTQHRFDEGHLVGELAKNLFEDGLDIKEVIPKENDNSCNKIKYLYPLSIDNIYVMWWRGNIITKLDDGTIFTTLEHI